MFQWYLKILVIEGAFDVVVDARRKTPAERVAPSHRDIPARCLAYNVQSNNISSPWGLVACPERTLKKRKVCKEGVKKHFVGWPLLLSSEPFAQWWAKSSFAWHRMGRKRSTMSGREGLCWKFPDGWHFEANLWVSFFNDKMSMCMQGLQLE